MESGGQRGAEYGYRYQNDNRGRRPLPLVRRGQRMALGDIIVGGNPEKSSSLKIII